MFHELRKKLIKKPQFVSPVFLASSSDYPSGLRVAAYARVSTDSWKSMFVAADAFDSVDCQIEGLGRIKAVQDVMLHIPRQLLREAIRHTATERQRSLTDLIYPYRRWMRNSILH
jgi:hypothetical protein